MHGVHKCESIVYTSHISINGCHCKDGNILHFFLFSIQPKFLNTIISGTQVDIVSGWDIAQKVQIRRTNEWRANWRDEAQDDQLEAISHADANKKIRERSSHPWQPTENWANLNFLFTIMGLSIKFMFQIDNNNVEGFKYFYNWLLSGFGAWNCEAAGGQRWHV